MVFPPLVLIVAVLGSILGGITNPTPAAALGAAGAIMLAAYRKLQDEGRSGRIVVWASFAIVMMMLLGDQLRPRVKIAGRHGRGLDRLRRRQPAYLLAIFGLLYACWVLLRGAHPRPGGARDGEGHRDGLHHPDRLAAAEPRGDLLRGRTLHPGVPASFDNEFAVFLIVMLVLFILGFVLDFLEIIYIVIPIVGPVIYGGTLDPAWVTIMIAVNLQTSFLTPPFGFALFYLRGVAPRR